MRLPEMSMTFVETPVRKGSKCVIITMKCPVRVWERRTEAMTFKEQLSEYISALACSAKELAAAFVVVIST